MSLMWKLLATTLLLSSLANASTTTKSIEEYLENEFVDNPKISDLDAKVISEKPLKQLIGWKSYIVNIHAILKGKSKREINQKMILFSNGQVISQELVDIKNGKRFTTMVTPDFQKKYYKKENLIYGHADAKHRVAIFSDPLCPFCKEFAPQALSYMKKYPKTFAVYYYHLPLVRIHPASAIIVRAAVVAKHQGVRDIDINMYKMKISSHEKNVKKILHEFNRVTGAKVTEKELSSPYVEETLKADNSIAENMMVRGTPTVYFDGKKDNSRKRYRSYK